MKFIVNKSKVMHKRKTNSNNTYTMWALNQLLPHKKVPGESPWDVLYNIGSLLVPVKHSGKIIGYVRKKIDNKR